MYRPLLFDDCCYFHATPAYNQVSIAEHGLLASPGVWSGKTKYVHAACEMWDVSLCVTDLYIRYRGRKLWVMRIFKGMLMRECLSRLSDFLRYECQLQRLLYQIILCVLPPNSTHHNLFWNLGPAKMLVCALSDRELCDLYEPYSIPNYGSILLKEGMDNVLPKNERGRLGVEFSSLNLFLFDNFRPSDESEIERESMSDSESEGESESASESEGKGKRKEKSGPKGPIDQPSRKRKKEK